MKDLENIAEHDIHNIGMKIYSAYTQVLSKRPVSFKINNIRVIMLMDDDEQLYER